MGRNVSESSSSVRSCGVKWSSSAKWWLAIFVAIIFFIIAAPCTYNLTNGIVEAAGLPGFLCAPGCPNIWGVLLHAVVFAIVLRIIMW